MREQVNNKRNKRDISSSILYQQNTYKMRSVKKNHAKLICVCSVTEEQIKRKSPENYKI